MIKEEKNFYLMIFGYNIKKPFEDEKGKEVFLKEFKEIHKEKFKSEKLNEKQKKLKEKEFLNTFLKVNYKKLKEKKINQNKVLCEIHEDLNFSEMINTFKLESQVLK